MPTRLWKNAKHIDSYANTMTPLRIGLIGLDTSHVSAFTRLLNDESDPHHNPRGRVTVAWPGGSPDFPLSIDRVDGFTRELRDERGVEILDSPEAVARACDIVFITAVDGRTHLDLVRRIAPARRPIFVDKPFALELSAAREMLRVAAEHEVPLMSCSSLRYAEHLQQELHGGRDDIFGVDVFGPMAEEPTQPGLFWYGCHSVEMMVCAMGPGCAEVRCVRNEENDALVATWRDGRVTTLRGARGGHGKFGVVLHRKDRAVFLDPYAGPPFYLSMLDAILGSLPEGRSAVPHEEMLEIVAIMEAANQSRDAGGIPVTVEAT